MSPQYRPHFTLLYYHCHTCLILHLHLVDRYTLHIIIQIAIHMMPSVVLFCKRRQMDSSIAQAYSIHSSSPCYWAHQDTESVDYHFASEDHWTHFYRVSPTSIDNILDCPTDSSPNSTGHQWADFLRCSILCRTNRSRHHRSRRQWQRATRCSTPNYLPERGKVDVMYRLRRWRWMCRREAMCRERDGYGSWPC